MGVEREYKFDVDPDWTAPELSGPAGGAERLDDENLVSTYFDTADLRLWSAGMTLRHRAENGEPVGKWTLKRPVPDDADDTGASVRAEVDSKGPREDMPTDIEASIAEVTAGAALVELAVLSSVRRRTRLGAGAPWAELDDDSVTVTSGPRQGLRFRQVEVELLGDPPAEALADVLGAIEAAGAAPGGGSKIGVAAGLEPPGM